MKLRHTKIAAFKTLNISQGSVATHFLLIMTVKICNNQEKVCLKIVPIFWPPCRG